MRVIEEWVFCYRPAASPRPRSNSWGQARNILHAAVATGRTYLIGFVVPDLLHPFFPEIAKALSEVLRRDGYYLVVSSSDEDPDLEEQEINQLLARRLDTLIVASCRTTVDLFFPIEKQNTPYVLVDRALPGLPAILLAWTTRPEPLLLDI